MDREAQAQCSPSIVSVSAEGRVVVRLADGSMSVLQIPSEQVEQLRWAAFGGSSRRRS